MRHSYHEEAVLPDSSTTRKTYHQQCVPPRVFRIRKPRQEILTTQHSHHHQNFVPTPRTKHRISHLQKSLQSLRHARLELLSTTLLQSCLLSSIRPREAGKSQKSKICRSRITKVFKMGQAFPRSPNSIPKSIAQRDPERPKKQPLKIARCYAV